MPIGTANDLEYKFYGDLGYTGSINDRRRAYWIATDSLNANLSFNDCAKAFYANNAIEVAQSNVVDLQRRYFRSGATTFGDSNSSHDLRYQKFGGT